MSDELQAEVVDDGFILDSNEDEVVENTEAPESPPAQELATPSDDQHEQSGTDSPELTSQEKHQKEVNKQHKKFRDEERERMRVEVQLKEANDKLADLRQAQNVEPTIPELPDQYDDNFASKVADRDEAIRKNAAWVQDQSSAQLQQQQAQQAQDLKQNEQLVDRVNSYTKSATEAGISPEDLQAAGQLVGNVISDDLTHHILDDKDGGLITTYLASNPTALEELSSMPIGSAAIYIENTVKPNLGATKPKPSSAPDPVPALKGGGIPPKEYGVKGATYE